MIRNETIGPKTRQFMIDNRAKFLMRSNEYLTLAIATDISTQMQTAYEWEKWNTFDTLRFVAESFRPFDTEHLDTDHSEECTCPF